MAEHQTRYALMRNTNEGFKRHLQGRLPRRLGRALPPPQAGDRRPVVACAALLFADNMRRIASFEDKAVADADGQMVKKRLGRPRRRALDDYLPGESDDAAEAVVTPRYGDPPDD